MISSALAFEMGSAPIPKHRVVISSPSVSCTPPCSRQCIGVEPFSPRAAARPRPARRRRESCGAASSWAPASGAATASAPTANAGIQSACSFGWYGMTCGNWSASCRLHRGFEGEGLSEAPPVRAEVLEASSRPPAPSLTASTHGLRRAPPPHRLRRRLAHAPSPPEVRCRCPLPGLPLPRRQRPPHLHPASTAPPRAPPSSPSPQA